MGPERNVYIVPYGVVYDPSRPKMISWEDRVTILDVDFCSRFLTTSTLLVA